MKKYLVIGKPISHSLSPDLHNFWIRNNNLDSKYEKKEVNKDEIKTFSTFLISLFLISLILWSDPIILKFFL